MDGLCYVFAAALVLLRGNGSAKALALLRAGQGTEMDGLA